MKNYFDMQSGIININGVRSILIDDGNVWASNKGQYKITISYKGISSLTFHYETKSQRDKVFEDLKRKLLD